MDYGSEWCPVHGATRLMGTGVTKGSDPYEILKLACGCEVVWFSKDDYAFIKGGH